MVQVQVEVWVVLQVGGQLVGDYIEVDVGIEWYLGCGNFLFWVMVFYQQWGLLFDLCWIFRVLYVVEQWVFYQCLLVFVQVGDVVIVLDEVYVWCWVDEVVGLVEVVFFDLV